MNSDVLARAEILSALVEAIKKDWRVGAMSPGLLTVEGQSQPFAYGAEATPGYIIRRALRFVFGFGPLHDWATQDPLDVDWVSAACICVRRELIGQIGELDERFPLYFEDVDWCLRMRAGGWRVVYNPNLRVIHLGGASQLSGNVKRKDLYYRSLLLFCDKHYGRNWKLLIQILLIPYRLYATARLWIQNIFQKP